MSQPQSHDQDETERDADKQANVMKDQLRKEVALWNAAREDASPRLAADPATAMPAVSTPRPAKRSHSAKAAVVSTPAPSGAPKKPFTMSFDGVTDAQHISYMISRGAR